MYFHHRKLCEAAKNDNNPDKLGQWLKYMTELDKGIDLGVEFFAIDMTTAIKELVAYFSRTEQLAKFTQYCKNEPPGLFKIIALFAKRIHDPLELFNQLHDGEVFKSGFFLHEYSKILELYGQHEKAAEILNKGIEENVRPCSVLESALKRLKKEKKETLTIEVYDED